MKLVAIIGLVLFVSGGFPSCSKEINSKPYSVVNVRFLGDEEDIFMETVEGSWDNTTKLARLYAHGYKFEEFNLYLPSLTSTGYYPMPTITNIYFSDGVDFIPFRLNSGFIYIDRIDSITVSGHFTVTLDDNWNGAETRTIIGGFGINIH